MSAIGTKRTSISTLNMTAFGGKADISDRLAERRTGQFAKDVRVSANPSPGPLGATDREALTFQITSKWSIAE